MPLIVPAYPAQPCHRMTVALGPVEGGGALYVLRFTWRARTASWYVDIFEGDGITAILVGRRLSPRWSPHSSIVRDGLPPGVLYVRGRDGFEREDLGSDNLRVVFFDEQEITDATPAEPDPGWYIA